MDRGFLFRLGADELGLGQEHVREILRYGAVTPVPGSPSWLRGVFNLRGKVLPVIDFAARLGMPAAPATARTCIVVIDVDLGAGAPVAMGLVVDAVTRIEPVAGESIQPPPAFGLAVAVEHVVGVLRKEGALVVLVDVVKAFTIAELAATVAPSAPAPARPPAPDEPLPGVFLFAEGA